MNKELKFEDLEQLYDRFRSFVKERNFDNEYNQLLISRPTLSIEKEAEYTMLVRNFIYEFLNLNGYTILNPMVISFILQFDRLYYGRMQETYIHCYR
jgi:hypothetical protein